MLELHFSLSQEVTLFARKKSRFTGLAHTSEENHNFQARFVELGQTRPVMPIVIRILQFVLRNGRTDVRTDRPSCSGASQHLETIFQLQSLMEKSKLQSNQWASEMQLFKTFIHLLLFLELGSSSSGCSKEKRLYFVQNSIVFAAFGGSNSNDHDSSRNLAQWPPGNARFDFDDTSQFHHPVMHKDEF